MARSPLSTGNRTAQAARAPVRVPAAVHLHVPEPPPQASRRVHQRRTRACDASARTSAGLLRDRALDGRARRQGPNGSGGVPDQEPAGRSAQSDVAEVLPGRRREVRMVEAPSDRRLDAGPDQARHGLRREPVGRRRPRHEGARRDPCRRRRRRPLRHAGHRHRHTHDHRDRGGRDPRVAVHGHQDGDRRQPLPVQRRQRRQHDGRVRHARNPRHDRQGVRRARGPRRADRWAFSLPRWSPATAASS